MAIIIRAPDMAGLGVEHRVVTVQHERRGAEEQAEHGTSEGGHAGSLRDCGVHDRDYTLSV